MNPRAGFRGAVVPGWSISVESFGVEFLLSPGRGSMAFIWFLRAWEPPPNRLVMTR